jgi:hypothetical protein
MRAAFPVKLVDQASREFRRRKRFKQKLSKISFDNFCVKFRINRLVAKAHEGT